MQKTTLTISGSVTIESSSLGTRITSTHYNDRHAQVYYAQRRLELAGWTVTPPRSHEGFRLPLKHPDEPMCQPLDAARPRARGFSATYGAAWLWLDASDGLPVKVAHGTAEIEGTLEALAALREAGLEF